MPLILTPLHKNIVSEGHSWTVNDETMLAKLIAHVALGQSRTVVKVLSDLGDKPKKGPRSAVKGARKLLEAKTKEEEYHRDGWMFQVISWIAAHLEDPNRLIRAPHMIWAHKGLDGLMVEMDGSDAVALVICEEKATGEPRKTIRDKVWPEFTDFETGVRDNELVAEVTTLLERHGELDCDAIIEATLWDEKRAYRVAVTGEKFRLKESSQLKLFRGFDVAVQGDLSKRRSAIMIVDDLRLWMKTLAGTALEYVENPENLES